MATVSPSRGEGPPHKSEMIYSVQIGRAVAALMVVMGHTNAGAMHFYGARPFGDAVSLGHIGVDFFFVLSGFIIFRAHSGDAAGYRPWRTYLAKRATRIYPPYWPIGIAMLLVYLLAPHLSEGVDRAPNILSSIFLIPGSAATWKGPTALIVAWTLIWEVMFYTIFSSFFFLRRAFPWIMGAWAAVVLAAIVAWPDATDGRYWSPVGAHNIEFLAGMGVAGLLQRAPFARRLASRWIVGLTGSGMLLAYLWFDGDKVASNESAQTLYFGIAFALLLLSISQIDLDPKAWPVRLPVFLGAASYAIYLVHDPAISIFNRIAMHFAGRVPPTLLFIAIAVSATIVGCVYHLLVEKPLIRLVSGYLRIRAARAVVGDAA